jgi:hypothetical protein
MSTPNDNLIAAIRGTRSPEFVAEFDRCLAEPGDAAHAYGRTLYEHNKKSIADIAAIARTPCNSRRELRPWAPDNE